MRRKKPPRWLTGACVVLFLASPLVWTAFVPGESEHAFEEALRAREKGELARALDLLHSVLQSEPDHPEAESLAVEIAREQADKIRADDGADAAGAWLDRMVEKRPYLAAASR